MSAAPRTQPSPRVAADPVARWYVAGPLDPEALAAALRVAQAVARGDSKHDVFTLFDTLNEQYGTDFDRNEFAQIARAVLHALVGIGGLEVKDPTRALQLWWASNTQATMAWALDETVALISPRGPVPLTRA